MALIAKAEKKLKGMFSFGNGKFEEAAELYGQAAKQYQLAKNCAPSLCAAVAYRRTSRHVPPPRAQPPGGSAFGPVVPLLSVRQLPSPKPLRCGACCSFLLPRHR